MIHNTFKFHGSSGYALKTVNDNIFKLLMLKGSSEFFKICTDEKLQNYNNNNNNDLIWKFKQFYQSRYFFTDLLQVV